jgi:hypothetical protein
MVPSLLCKLKAALQIEWRLRIIIIDRTGRGIAMKKSELLRSLQNEIQRHNLSTFMSEHKIVQTSCSACQKHFGTVEQFKRHITEDVLPRLLDKLSSAK